MEDTETSFSMLFTLAPFLLHFLIPIFPFSHVSCVPDMILKEFSIEFIPFKQVRLAFPMSWEWKFGAGMGMGTKKLEARVCESG